jgi:XTP/dITP diphosphohydrolase
VRDNVSVVPVRLVLATANPHKVEEIRAILGAAIPGLELVPRPTDVPDVVEDADTLVGNARLKAVALFAATGIAAVADDTGLEVDALDGAPGVYSARYAGEHATYLDNCTKLLAELDRVGAHHPSQRTARFRTVAFVAWPDDTETVAQGEVSGTIEAHACGERGFGYDPVFVPTGARYTFAEMSAAEKNAISHRARAFHALAEALRSSRAGT